MLQTILIVLVILFLLDSPVAPGQFIGERRAEGNLQQILSIVQRPDLPSLVLNDVSLNAIP